MGEGRELAGIGGGFMSVFFFPGTVEELCMDGRFYVYDGLEFCIVLRSLWRIGASLH